MANWIKGEKSTWKSIARDDPKDKIEVIVGDDKQDNFFPQIKIERWDNEVNFSVRLINDEKSPKVTLEGDKITWSGDRINAEFSGIEPCEEHPEGGCKFEYILKQKPASNKLLFTIETKGLDFFYQPELTPEEIKQGASRPDNVVGSYAVYHSGNPVNYVGGKEYKAGKALHIYRPKLIDAKGDWTWGDLNIDVLNKTYTVTIPQNFLDKAVYPIKSNDTFGYTTKGANSGGRGNGYASLVKGTPVGGDGRVSKISFYADQYDVGAGKGCIWLYSSKALLTDGVASAKTIITGWNDSIFSIPPSVINNTAYYVGVVDAGGGGAYYYDFGSAGDGGIHETNNYTTPINLGTINFNTVKHSIYATYTPMDIEILRPNATGDSTQFQCLPGAGEENWENVDDETADGDTTCVRRFNVDAKDLYNIVDPTLADGATIYGVIVRWCCKYYTSSWIYGYYGIKSGETENWSNLITFPIGYTNYSKYYATDPNTGLAWTKAAITALQVGVKILKADSGGMRCTQIYVEVGYEAAPPPSYIPKIMMVI